MGLELEWIGNGGRGEEGKKAEEKTEEDDKTQNEEAEKKGKREQKKEEKNSENKNKKDKRTAGDVCTNRINSKTEMNLRLGMQLQDSKWFLENSNWLNTKEAAEYLRTSPKQIRKWVYQGRMNTFRLLGWSLRFKKSDLDLLIEGGRKWE